MRKLLIASFLATTQFAVMPAWSQTDIFYTWVSGADTTNQFGDYGTIQVASSTNVPGARENSVSWTDAENNLWLFGGQGYASSGAEVLLNDLWKFNPETEEWTWVSGTNLADQHGVYGTLGTASSSNYPGARQNAHAWTDNSGNLWLFGGNGFAATGPPDFLNDLWKYDISADTWTWISGSAVSGATATYGSQGIANSSNAPGARYGGNTWFASDKLWLFGGQGWPTVQERYNDLWCFDPNTGLWTWVSGSNLPDQNGSYGTQGVSSISNMPGARQASVSWIDDAGNFWIYGGYGFAASGSHNYLNDLWKYNPSTNEWVWMNGNDVTNTPATYGTMGTPNTANNPGARQMSVAWKSTAGDLYLFGAWGHCGFTGGASFGRLNDLWKYSVQTNTWTWIGGEKTPDGAGTYGVQGSASVNNLPGARRMDISWTDTTGAFWLFGGNGYDKNGSLGLLNDLWKIEFDGVGSSSEFVTTNYQCYPNPVEGVLTIQSYDADEHTISIISMAGQTVYSNTLEGQMCIDLSHLAPGIYLLKIDQFEQKIIKP